MRCFAWSRRPRIRMSSRRWLSRDVASRWASGWVLAGSRRARALALGSCRFATGSGSAAPTRLGRAAKRFSLVAGYAVMISAAAQCPRRVEAERRRIDWLRLLLRRPVSDWSRQRGTDRDRLLFLLCWTELSPAAVSQRRAISKLADALRPAAIGELAARAGSHRQRQHFRAASNDNPSSTRGARIAPAAANDGPRSAAQDDPRRVLLALPLLQVHFQGLRRDLTDYLHYYDDEFATPVDSLLWLPTTSSTVPRNGSELFRAFAISELSCSPRRGRCSERGSPRRRQGAPRRGATICVARPSRSAAEIGWEQVAAISATSPSIPSRSWLPGLLLASVSPSV